MKPSVAANLALSAAVVSAPLLFFGFTGFLGDPSPRMSEADVARHIHEADALVGSGFFTLFASFWLSGYSFAAARVRSLIALLICFTVFAAAFELLFVQ